MWRLRGENPQNRPLIKFKYRRFALGAMLPVKFILHAAERSPSGKAEAVHYTVMINE